MDVLERAKRIAQEDLDGNIQVMDTEGVREQVLLTGSWKFEEVWARDFCFAVPSLLLLGKNEVVRDTLDAFCRFQREDGLFARKLSSMGNAWRNIRVGLKRIGIVVPISRTLVPEYRTAFGKEPKDVNPLLIKAMAEYGHEDAAFLHDRAGHIGKALEYIAAHSDKGMIVQAGCEDWADHTNRKGKVLYTNAALLLGLRELGKHEMFRERAEKMESALVHGLEELWCGHAYANAIDNGSRDETIAIPGNLLMLLADSTGARSAAIRKTLCGIIDAHGYAPITATPYPSKHRPLNRMFAAAYNDGKLVLPWIQCLAAMALDDPVRSERLLRTTAELIVSHGSCIEAALPDGRLLSYPLTTQEFRFSWTAAMYLEAFLKKGEVLEEYAA